MGVIMSSLLRGLAAFILVASLAGCASSSFKTMDATTKAKVTASDGVAGIRQSEIYAVIPQNNGGGGLLGALIGAAAENSAINRVQKEVAPVRDALLDFDFDGQTVSDLQQQLVKVDWLHLGNVTLTKDVSSDGYDKAIDDSQKPYTLFVTLDYHLSFDFKQLFVTARINLLPKPIPGSTVRQGPNGSTFKVSASDPGNSVYSNTVS